jgi:alanyl-tRNA synthetase
VELDAVERSVNGMIRANVAVDWKTMPMDDARRLGAMMRCGEKYGVVVRVVSVGDRSRELCGGTHLDATGAIGQFVITSEGSVGAGLRRIEARTGRGAETYVRARLRLLDEVASLVGTASVDMAPQRVSEILERARDLEREAEGLRERVAAGGIEALAQSRQDVGGVAVVAGRVDAGGADALRQQVDMLRAHVPSGVIVLGAVIDGAPRLTVAVSDDLTRRGLHAGQLVKTLAQAIAGGGGGRPTLAEAGGKDAGGLSRAIDEVAEVVRRALNGS